MSILAWIYEAALDAAAASRAVETHQAARTRIADRTWQSVYNILETASNEADRGAGRSTSADAWAALAR